MHLARHRYLYFSKLYQFSPLLNYLNFIVFVGLCLIFCCVTAGGFVSLCLYFTFMY